MRDFSYQLYSSRNFGPMADTLRMVAAAGYRQVEGYGALYADMTDVGKLKSDLTASGLTMPTGHFGFDVVSQRPDEVIEIARALDMAAVIIPYLPPDQQNKDAAGWAEFGQALSEAGKPIRDAGLEFGWHNHAFEFSDIGVAERPLDLILSGSEPVQLELDLAWAQVAGQNPEDWVKKYGDRLISVHIKDIAPDGACADEDGWADVGHGVLDWRLIVQAVDASTARYFIMEHDNPSDDARFARRSIAAANAF